MALIPITFAEAINFSRSTTAMRINSAGLLENVAVNAQRLDYDPVSKGVRGLLLEAASTNLFVRSNDFSQAIWSKALMNVVAYAGVAPDGSATATKLVETAATGVHRVQQAISGLTIGDTLSFGFWVKADGRTVIDITNITIGSVRFDLASGAITSTTGGAIGKIQAFPNGWYRVSMPFVLTATSVTLQLRLVNEAASGSYLGDGVSGILIWGAQAEILPFLTSYIPTGASQVTRAADVAIVSSGALSSGFNAEEGTIFADFAYSAGASDQNANGRTVIQLDDGTNLNRLQLYNASGRRAAYVWRNNPTSVVVAQDGVGVIASENDIVKAAITYKANDYAMAVAGNIIGTDLSLSSNPPLNRLVLGTGLFGHIRSVRYHPARLSNARLQELTL